MKPPFKDWLPDSLFALLRDGYDFASHRRRELGSDIFQSRFLVHCPVFIGGPDAARFFYDTDVIKREGVAIGRIRKTLLGEGGIHGLDADAHRHRKAMFLAIMGPERLGPFSELMTRFWDDAVSSWSAREKVEFFPEAQRLISRAMCHWAGIPLSSDEVETRTTEMYAMIDAFGGAGWRNWRGRLARRSHEAWLRGIVEQSRSGALRSTPGSAVYEIAHYRDLNGKLLDLNVAAVELSNSFRPMLAAVYFMELQAAILMRDDNARRRVIDDDTYCLNFAQEARRFYPFTPFLGGKACHDTEWNGHAIPKDTVVLLDVYGIHHDPRIWPGPDIFNPDRFLSRPITQFNLLQQGGGRHPTGHRCAGEWFTVETMKIASRALAKSRLQGDAGPIEFDLSRIPSRLKRPVILRATEAPHIALHGQAA